MGKLLVTRRSRTLLLNSETIKDYNEAYTFIRENSNLKDDELNLQTEYIQNFFNNLYDKILKQAVEEWTPDSDEPVYILDDDNKIPCQLCNIPIKNVCNISNKINNKKLTIGTECLKHFGMDMDISVEELLKKTD